MDKRKLQRSKKTKRAWRKNIDLDEIEKRLDERREEIIEQGGSLEELDEAELFYVDEEEDQKITKRMKRDNIKPLKSWEIINKRSKVPALNVTKPKVKKIDGVTPKEIRELMKLSGRVKGVRASDARLSKEGMIRGKAYDLWNDDLPDEKAEKAKPAAMRQSPMTSFPSPKVAPDSKRNAPKRLRVVEVIPHGGKSYNPEFDTWRKLIEQEYFKEKSKEDRRIALLKEKERIQYIIDNFDDEEVEEDDDDAEGEEDEEKTSKADEDYRVSLNPPTQTKIKTRAQRNKQARRKKMEQMQAEVRTLKEMIKELEKLPEIEAEVAQEKQERLQRRELEKQQKQQALNDPERSISADHTTIEKPLEVKLSDELTDSLRKLKPEGNLLQDQMQRIQYSGKVDTVKHGKRAKHKYKTFVKLSHRLD